MNLTDFFSRLTLEPRDAEAIFDRDEPVGRPTDMVMPARRWFRRRHHKADDARVNRGGTGDVLNRGPANGAEQRDFSKQ